MMSVQGPIAGDAQTESEYEAAAASELQRLLMALDSVEDEVDTELSDGILSMEFADGTRYLVNSHRAARQIWMAANTKAWHFEQDPQTKQWRSTKGDEELWEALSSLLSEKLGRSITLTDKN